MINICGLWKSTSKDGKQYFSGNIGNAKILIFPNDKRGNEKAPDYQLVIAEKSKNKPESNKPSNTTDDDLAFQRNTVA